MLHLVKNIVNNVVLYFVNNIINVVLSTVNKVVKTKINNIHRLTYVFLSLLRMENPYHIHVVPFSLNKFKHTLLDADDFQETPRMVWIKKYLREKAVLKVMLHGTIFNATLLREKSIRCNMTINWLQQRCKNLKPVQSCATRCGNKCCVKNRLQTPSYTYRFFSVTILR